MALNITDRFKVALYHAHKIKDGDIESSDNMYMKVLEDDINKQLSELLSLSALPASFGVPPIYIDFNSSLIFDANIEINSEGEVVRNLSRGCIHAIDDLFARLGANKGFYSFNRKHQKLMWDGCECLWTRMGGRVQPERRYYDYEEKCNAEGVLGSEGSYLSRYYEAIPLELERIKLVQLMNNIAFLWILLHEEGHFLEGHLLYLEDRFGISARSRLMIQEAGSSQSSDEFDQSEVMFRKVMEWQADRFATRGVFDIFFRQEIAQILPEYAQNDPARWLLRLLYSVIGSVILIFQKARSLNGVSTEYPSPLTRIASTFHVGLDRATDLRSETLGLSKGLTEIWSLAIMEAFEDLGFTSVLLNKEGEVKDWNPGEIPDPDATHHLGLLDTNIEISALGQVVGNSFLPNSMVKDILGEKRYGVHLKLYDRVFNELDSIINFHESIVYGELEAYRKKAGGICS